MLNKEEIKTLVHKGKLIEGYINLDKQLTPNGFDLTVGKVFEFCSGGDLDFSNSERRLPEAKEIVPEKVCPQDKFGWRQLPKGVYKVRTNEVINVPKDLIALAFSRTSLLRMGSSTYHGVWDAGFSGWSEFLLVVENPYGLRLKENARIAQLVFFKISETEGYKGVYNNFSRI